MLELIMYRIGILQNLFPNLYICFLEEEKARTEERERRHKVQKVREVSEVFPYQNKIVE